MNNTERYQLLNGPYKAPSLRKGDRATSQFRDGDLIVTSWINARIPWPRCREFGTRGGGLGLLVEE